MNVINFLFFMVFMVIFWVLIYLIVCKYCNRVLKIERSFLCNINDFLNLSNNINGEVYVMI